MEESNLFLKKRQKERQESGKPLSDAASSNEDEDEGTSPQNDQNSPDRYGHEFEEPVTANNDLGDQRSIDSNELDERFEGDMYTGETQVNPSEEFEAEGNTLPQQPQQAALPLITIKDAEPISDDEIDFAALDNISEDKYLSEKRKLELEEKRLKVARDRVRLEIETTKLEREKAALSAERAKKKYYQRRQFG